jgi:hypothetical protein
MIADQSIKIAIKNLIVMSKLTSPLLELVLVGARNGLFIQLPWPTSEAMDWFGRSFTS